MLWMINYRRLISPTLQLIISGWAPVWEHPLPVRFFLDVDDLPCLVLLFRRLPGNEIRNASSPVLAQNFFI
jgi:hypothetical protein